MNRLRWLLLALVAALAVLWFTPGASVPWLRPVLLALGAGVVAVWYWRRSAGYGAASRAAAPAAGAVGTRDLWDALDRGEDPTDDARR
ncbi:hypothetical protein Cs7R123_22440 [Catellatospora sp. TT07R-123]|uniref:Trp biosynthesis-associated membrane protein n=1 Tax=Catellatospora sp. TT07R-123 TaxID=2733863 RepID=UPI001B0DCCBB|nr:Trp biosynthesis-associated membrane protein [Catellatospora sp. TT07R-123]GHJ44902.1 hypothetical protein Cs7R123_22440 [Catellatospora sp. TT07R-123]